MALAAPPELLLGPCKTIGSTLLHCDSGPTRNIRHFQLMGLLESSGYFHAFSTYGLTWAFPTSLIKLQDGFYQLLRQISASLCGLIQVLLSLPKQTVCQSRPSACHRTLVFLPIQQLPIPRQPVPPLNHVSFARPLIYVRRIAQGGAYPCQYPGIPYHRRTTISHYG